MFFLKNGMRRDDASRCFFYQSAPVIELLPYPVPVPYGFYSFRL